VSLLIGIDLGTASAKGALVRPDGTLVAQAHRPHQLSLPRPGWAEHDAEQTWWQSVCVIGAELAARAGGESIAGVAVSGIGPCLLPCDRDLLPLRPAILYGIDARAGAEIEECIGRYGAEAILRRGGSPLTSQAIGPKLLWLRRNEPELWERTSRWYMASSFAVARLTGEYVLDHHSASQSDPLYDIERHQWAGELVEELAPGLAMPRLVDPDERVGVVTPAAAEQTGLPVGTPVMAGTIDACAEALSVGVREPGDMMLMYGSTIFIIQISAQARPHPGMWMTVALAPPSRALAAGMATSGSLTAWLRELTGARDFTELADAAQSVPAGARGLLVLPYFAGERSPLFDPDLRGGVLGLTLSHGPAELARAVYEGVAFSVRHNLEVLAAAGGPPTRVTAVGGGTTARLWPQIVSSVAGVEQLLPEQRLGACYGDALLAARGAGLASRSADWTRIADVVVPDPEQAALYDELYELYLELGSSVAGTSHSLAGIQRELAAGRALSSATAGPQRYA
jgi:xylulokinase